MQILLVTSRYLPHRGGLETVVRELAAQMSSAGHRVTIVTNRYPRTLPRQEIIDQIPVIRLMFLYPELQHLRAGRLDLWLAGLIFLPFTLFKLFRLIQTLRPNVVNLHYVSSPTFFVWLTQLACRFRLVVSLHGADVEIEPFQSHFKRWLFQAILQRAEQVTACSHVLLKRALVLSPNIAPYAQVIHNGVNARLFSSAEPYEYPCPYLLTVGRLEHQKGVDVLISAYAQIARNNPNLSLLIAGDGLERPKLEVQIEQAGLSDRVRLLGAVPREQVASLMRGSLLIVIPSRREPFGIVGLEAMASGRPIVARKVGGLIEALGDAEVTWVADDEVSSLVEALEVGLARAKQTSIVERNQQMAQFSSWQAVAEHYLRLYQGQSSSPSS